MPRPSSLAPLLALVGALGALAACHVDSPSPDGARPGDAATDDLAVGDLMASDRQVPLVDATTSPVDASAPGDLGACGGGYLNSDAGSACPLACSPLVEAVADEGHPHVPYPTVVAYRHNPPASGPHWGFPDGPAPWGRHEEVVAPEAWVHNLEHGGVVFLYNCPAPDAGPYTDASAPPDACPEVIAALVQLYQNYPQRYVGDMALEKLILITPDPALPGKVAAVAWDWSYVSNDLDTNALDCFLHARYNHGPEKLQ